jgi:hypothetical protein
LLYSLLDLEKCSCHDGPGIERFGGVKYDEMIPNLKYKGKHDEVEFDIALVNGDSVALIEVKHRIHPSFVIDIAERKIETTKPTLALPPSPLAMRF